jgi:3-deoxy-D-manno-octulosonate 8-phosphate phosphatase (KDO 8-P phosphatase)
VAILSRARDPHLRDRFLKLGLQEVYLGCLDKEETLREFATVYDLAWEEILYMGDDVPDLGALRRCGVPTCPRDAAAEVREASIYISPFDGGKGCVRDVISQVLRLNGQWV